MAEILSQSEIDELLVALASGQSASSGDSRAKQQDDKVRVYDFRSANKFSKEQIRMLNFIYDSYAGRLATFLSGTLRTMCEVEVVSVEEQTFAEFTNSLPVPAFLGILNMPPLTGNALFELSSAVAYEIVSRLLGGTGYLHEEANKLFTEIEISILSRITRQMISYMGESWERVVNIEAELERVETSAQFAQIVNTGEPIAIITMNVKVGEVSDIINLCIPHLAIQPIAKQLAMKKWYNESSTTAAGESNILPYVSPKIAGTPINMRVYFNETQATVRDVLNLQVGDVLRIEHQVREPVTAVIEHIPKFKGYIGIKGQKLALMISDILKEAPKDE
ncbi:MAG: flagellar motor switch protein FliM [Clostridiaceae bacterium]|nr:flagellar motor switch protein FliM [Eubacteriales bacterium]